MDVVVVVGEEGSIFFLLGVWGMGGGWSVGDLLVIWWCCWFERGVWR